MAKRQSKLGAELCGAKEPLRLAAAEDAEAPPLCRVVDRYGHMDRSVCHHRESIDD
jgi:hypothetical protein